MLLSTCFAPDVAHKCLYSHEVDKLIPLIFFFPYELPVYGCTGSSLLSEGFL